MESTREEEQMEDIEVESEWETDGTVQEKHEPLVEGREKRPTREENNEEHEGLSVESRENNVDPSDDDRHLKEDQKEFSVEPMEHEMWVSRMVQDYPSG